MPHGKTLIMNAIDNARRWRITEPRDAKPRDRSLHGKARIKARKAARREGR